MKPRRFAAVSMCLVLFLAVLPPGLPWSAPPTTERAPGESAGSLRNAVMGAGATRTLGGNATVRGTMGQPLVTNQQQDAVHAIHEGFWAWLWVSREVVGVLPATFFTNRLFQNYPNPFRAGTTIAYSVSRTGPVKVSVYDVSGRRVRTLKDSVHEPGLYEAAWDGTGEAGFRVAAGIYFYEFETGDSRTVKKLLVLR